MPAGFWYNKAKLYFYWPYTVVSMIWNTSELSALHISRATAIFVFDGSQIGPKWMFGLKMYLMASANFVGGTTEKRCIFPGLICYYQWCETLPNCLYHTSAVPQPFLLLIAANLALAGCWAENGAYGLCQIGWRYNGEKLYFSWLYMLVSIIWNNSGLSAPHLGRATAIFVFDCCQVGPIWMFGLKK